MAKGKKVVLPDLGSFLKIRRMDIAQFYQSLNGKSFDDRVEEAKKKFNVKSAEMTDLSISLAINFGPGTVGLVLFPAE